MKTVDQTTQYLGEHTPEDIPHVKLEGFLAKRSAKSGRTWRRRFFVLDGTKLFYYRSSRDVKPREEIEITSSTFVKKSPTRPFCLELCTNRQILFICADQEETQNLWLDALTLSIEIARLQRSRGVPSMGNNIASPTPSDTLVSMPKEAISSTSTNSKTGLSESMRALTVSEHGYSNDLIGKTQLAGPPIPPSGMSPDCSPNNRHAGNSSINGGGASTKIDGGTHGNNQVEPDLPDYLVKHNNCEDNDDDNNDDDDDSSSQRAMQIEESKSCGHSRPSNGNLGLPTNSRGSNNLHHQHQINSSSTTSTSSGSSASTNVTSTTGFGRASNLFRRFKQRRRGSSQGQSTSSASEPAVSETPVNKEKRGESVSSTAPPSTRSERAGSLSGDAQANKGRTSSVASQDSLPLAVVPEPVESFDDAETAPKSQSRRGSTCSTSSSLQRTSGVLRARPTHRFSTPATTFEVDTRYSYVKSVGTGAYGVVVSANDRISGDKVAIKKVARAFEDLVDAKRILREIKLLRHFDHENIINIRDLMAPARYNYDDIYIVSELMETDLHRVIYSKQKLTNDHIQYFVYQTLRALKYIHSANVIHRDLKPSNLLLNSNCDLKICDFGLARGLEDSNLELTEYVVTRWYRAPEIMLACREYTKSIDVWAVGCIFAELLVRKPLVPGEDYIHQLQLITDVLGTPRESDMHFIRSDKAKRFMRAQPLRPKRNYAEMFPNASSEGLDLLDKMLQFNPDKRISVEDALAHPYLGTLYQPNDEPTCPSPFLFDDNKPDDELCKRDIQDQILQEVLLFHPEDAPRFIAEQKAANPDAAFPLQAPA